MDHNDIACLYDKVSGKLFYSEGSEDFVAGEKIPPDPPQYKVSEVEKNISLQVSSNAGVENIIDVDLGFSLQDFSIDVILKEKANKAILSCDKLNTELFKMRSNVASCANRLESIINLQNNDIINLTSVNSLIKDADIAHEASKMAQANILQEISTSLFSQSNLINKNMVQVLLRL